MSDAYTRSLEARVAALERQLDRVERRMTQGVAFARSTANPDDTGAVQTVQGQLDALTRRDALPVLSNYGFSSAMPKGGDKLVVFGNTRSLGVVVGTNHQAHRYRNLLVGETVLYDMWGHAIRLRETQIEVAGNYQITGDLHVTGAVIAGFGGADQVTLQQHVHGTGSAAAGTSVPTPGH